VSPGASSEEDELDFELAYQRSLSTAQRFEMMLTRSPQLFFLKASSTCFSMLL